MNKLFEELKIDNTLTKNHFRQKKYNSVFLHIPHHNDLNEMADLISLPETKQGFQYLFVICDLFSFKFDFRPLKNKQSQTVLDAMIDIFNKSKYIHKPLASISTDNGSEFKSVFHKWVFDENIHHKFGLPYRHKQQSVIESLNNQITRLLMTYLSNKSKGLKDPYQEWTDILDNVLLVLNKHRQNILKKKVKKYGDYSPLYNQEIQKLPKFKIGQAVHYKLDKPQNSNHEQLTGEKARNGDNKFSTVTRKITKVIVMNDYPFYRYMLEEIPQCSYSEYELLPAHVNYSTYVVKQIIGKQTIKNKLYYKVWWKGYLKKNATNEPVEKLIEDGLFDEIEQYENSLIPREREKISKINDKVLNAKFNHLEKDDEIEPKKLKNPKLIPKVIPNKNQPNPIPNNNINPNMRITRSQSKNILDNL